MHDFLKILLLGALLSMIFDTTHGVYDSCGTNGFCHPHDYPICESVKGKCPKNEICCVDRHKLYIKPTKPGNFSKENTDKTI